MATIDQWPMEQDALIAAPKHHTLLYENEFVRVIDANIPAGETTALHTHQFPASHYFLSWSDFIRYDGEGNVLADSRSMDLKPAAGTAVWSGPLALHSLSNIGNNSLHVISVEIKNK